MKLKPPKTALLSIIALVLALSGSLVHAAIVAVGDAQVSIVAPNAAGVYSSTYNTTEVVAATPATAYFSFKGGFFDTTTQQNLDLLSVVSAKFTLGVTNPANSFVVNLGGVFSAPGSGSPSYATWNSAGAVTTASVYSSPLVGTSLPADTEQFTFTGLAVTGAFQGGSFNVSPTRDQTGTYEVVFNTSQGQQTVTGIATLTMTPVPEPGTLLMASLGICSLALGRRRPADATHNKVLVTA